MEHYKKIHSINKIFTGIWISLACACVMLLTGSLIVIFYIATFFRKIMMGSFIPNSKKFSIKNEKAQRKFALKAKQLAMKNFDVPFSAYLYLIADWCVILLPQWLTQLLRKLL